MRKRSTPLRVLNFVMLLAFLLSAAVQYNDPDALVWMLLYGAAAVACFFFARGRMHWAVPAVVGAVAFAWAATLVPHVLGRVGFGEMFASMQMKDPRVELGRELGGLSIVAAWMAVLTVAKFEGRSSKVAQP